MPNASRDHAPVETSAVADEAQAAARCAGLRYIAAGASGIRRVGVPGAFRYLDDQDKVVRDKDTLERIRKLAIPPAYTAVWICAAARGHLQATGRDARGRKQYRYHAQWRLVRDETKFDRMIAFAESLPRLRRHLGRDLAQPGLSRNKVLALIVALLDVTRVRIGNDAYARDNGSFGLTTLRNRHARFAPGGLRLSFRGKGGVDHDVVIDDRRLARIVKRCQQLPGQQLFQYLDADGARHSVDSGMVNEYLREVTGYDFSAKDFRTWGATLSAVTLMARMPLPEPATEQKLKACITAAIREVAADLRNTPVVCRKSYINPIVFTGWRDGSLHRIVGAAPTSGSRKSESLALKFLKGQANA